MALSELPPPLPGDNHAAELLRAFIASDGGLHVSVSTSWKQPDAWGILLADIARHVSRAYAAEGLHGEEETLKRIRDLWDAEFADPTDLGKASRMKFQ